MAFTSFRPNGRREKKFFLFQDLKNFQKVKLVCHDFLPPSPGHVIEWCDSVLTEWTKSCI